jgi:hypothetical protein
MHQLILRQWSVSNIIVVQWIYHCQKPLQNKLWSAITSTIYQNKSLHHLVSFLHRFIICSVEGQSGNLLILSANELYLHFKHIHVMYWISEFSNVQLYILLHIIYVTYHIFMNMMHTSFPPNISQKANEHYICSLSVMLSIITEDTYLATYLTLLN